ncbi:MAG: PTS IIA-like nitrogen-regulatory protein PtsN [Pseudohongiella sp.]|nr:MAG: PTS IIA-like nitrogen-regulatory protein PtsN [Pseudohongiella sp.]
MQLEDILSPDRCHCRIEGISKKRILIKVSEIISENIESLEAEQVFDALVAREQLGTTGLGNGIAIPHCRLAPCENIIGALITLDDPVDFDSLDDQPVDILFVLLVPHEENDEHVRTLGELAALFNDEDFCYTIRHTFDSEDLYNIAITY